MAVGRQDYQAGVVPVKSGYSLSQTPYFDTEGKNIDSSEGKEFCKYTVPIGYQLNVCGYRVIASIPFINIFTIFIDTTIIMNRVFDFDLNDNFPEGANLIIKGGETFKIVLFNMDEITQFFYAQVFGFTEQIET